MKDRVDQSRGIVTLIPEDLAKIKPKESREVKVDQVYISEETKLFRFLR